MEDGVSCGREEEECQLCSQDSGRDVLAESQFRKVDNRGDKDAGQGVKVIDMTGREQRVLSG